MSVESDVVVEDLLLLGEEDEEELPVLPSSESAEEGVSWGTEPNAGFTRG